jgi:hypothetical protein
MVFDATEGVSKRGELTGCQVEASNLNKRGLSTNASRLPQRLREDHESCLAQVAMIGTSLHPGGQQGLVRGGNKSKWGLGFFDMKSIVRCGIGFPE